MVTRISSRKKSVLVKACLNGGRGREDHKRVPITPAELAKDAKEVAAVGAAAVHLHPRAEDGSQTLGAEWCGKAIAAIRNACRVPIGVSTASWIVEKPSRKVSLIESWKVNPDFASVNLNEEGWRDVCRALTRRGVWIEAGLWTLSDAQAFVSSKLEKTCLRVLVEIHETNPGEVVSLANGIDRVLVEAKVGLPILHHGRGPTTWKVLENALELRRDIRVGLEDTISLPDGRRAAGNAQLVERAVSMVRRHGLVPLHL